MGTTTKAFIAKDDLKIWDGINATFTRKTSSGGTASYAVIDWVGIDVYVGFGTRDDTALSSAMDQIGASRVVKFFLSPGTWTIGNDITITSNITLACPPGVTISVNAAKTLTIQGPIEAGPYQIFGGAGTVTISGVQIIHDRWGDGSGDAYFPSTDNSVDLGKSTNEFKDIYSDGKIYADDISLGADIIPETDNASDLGSSTKEFKDLYVDGVIYADTISLQGDIDPGATTQARFDDSDYITVAIRDASQQIIHEVPLSQAFSPQSGWV